MVLCCHVIGLTLLKTTLCAHHFFFYSFTASDGSEGTTAGYVVSPHFMMVHRGFRSARKQNINYIKQHYTIHCWIPTRVMYPVNLTKCRSCLTRSISSFAWSLQIYNALQYNVCQTMFPASIFFINFIDSLLIQCHQHK